MGLKLLEMFKNYLKKRVIHMEAVFRMAMIAVACKVIVLDVKESPSTTLLGIVSVIALYVVTHQPKEILGAKTYLGGRGRRASQT
jgi:uncharacterized membrane protein (DUF373 family)